MPPMNNVPGSAPSEPNAFSDASVAEPTNLKYSVAGVGVWTSDPVARVTGAAADFVHERPHEGGRGFWGPAQGERVSTGRAEAMAAMVALYLSTPVHLAVDNAGVCRKLARLLRSPERPPSWAFVRDGDVWA
eukprot:908265-Alexandrium_andersonii.AAC.1